MSAEIARHAATGRGLTFYVFEGRPCVVATAVGRVLGYGNDGKKLPDRVRDDWGNEFILGRDHDVLTGARLRAFKALLGDSPEPGVSATARLMVLYESGFDPDAAGKPRDPSPFDREIYRSALVEAVVLGLEALQAEDARS